MMNRLSKSAQRNQRRKKVMGRDLHVSMPRCSNNGRNTRTFKQLLAADMDGLCPIHNVTGQT
jgi:hypothetical protein